MKMRKQKQWQLQNKMDDEEEINRKKRWIYYRWKLISGNKKTLIGI